MFPFIMRLKMRSEERKGISLCIPVIPVWIFLGALMTVLVPVLFLAVLLTSGPGPGMRLLLIYPLFFSLLGNLSGLHVETRVERREFLISFR